MTTHTRLVAAPRRVRGADQDDGGSGRVGRESKGVETA